MESFIQWMKAYFSEGVSEKILTEFRDKVRQQYMVFFSESVGRYLNIPPLGPARESLQKMMSVVEAHNQLLVSLGKFLQDFSGPYIQSLVNLPRILDDADNQIQNSDDLYKAWTAILAEHYQDYLSSSEGVRSVAELIDQYLEFKKHFDDALEPVLKFYTIPTKREMEDVYSRLHQLKERHRELKTTLLKQDETIENLHQQIQALQTAAAGSPKTRKTTSTGKKKSAKKSGAASAKPRRSRTASKDQ